MQVDVVQDGASKRWTLPPLLSFNQTERTPANALRCSTIDRLPVAFSSTLPFIYAMDLDSAPVHRRNFLLTLVATTAVKLWLAAAIPFTGDESYFWLWGQYPNWGGFYDHPPMAGWWLWAMDKISSSTFVLRLPAVMLWIVIAFGLMDLLRRAQPHAPDKAWLLGTLFLLLPFTWSLNLITTDTPLIFFLFVSGYAFLRAEQSGTKGWLAMAGMFLGLALLSKYFAGLLAIAYAVALLPRGPRAWGRLLIIAVCAAPFMGLNLLWNATHCWDNILFNLFNRNDSSQLDPLLLLVYLGMMLYLLTPWTAGRMVRHGRVQGALALITLFAVPFALFLALSLYKTIGLHWVLAFLPFFFLWVGLSLDERALIADRKWTLLLGLPHLLALILLAHLPADYIKGRKLHTDIIAHREAPALIERFRQDLPPDATIMSPSYSFASILSYHGNARVPVFGPGSYHARFDDSLTNFRDYDRRTIRVVSAKPLREESFSPFFDSVLLREVELSGARFWIADGTGFRFTTYREIVLSGIARSYYRAPSWLPAASCRFLDQYELPREPR